MSEDSSTNLNLQKGTVESRWLESCLYKPLDHEKKQIRILLVLPGEFKDPICCNLLIARLDDKPNYNALSYVWGDPSRRLPIFVNGQEHHITTNLYRALRRIRSSVSVCTLWVDALCINQSDPNERSHQVRLMKDIFSSTKEAILFVGDHKSDVSDPSYTKDRENTNPESYELKHQLYSASFIRKLQSELEMLNKDSGSVLGIKEVLAAVFLACALVTKGHQSILNDGGIPRAFTNEAAKSLTKVLQLPWFTRIWTVQEAVTPEESVIVIGSIKLSWFIMMEAARLAKLWKLDKFQLSRDQTQVLDELEMKVLPLRNEHEVFQQRYGSEHYRLLQRYQHRKATDPRDKIFALLAMTDGMTSGQLIEPDYTMDFGSIYTTMCRRIIENYGSLEALAQRLVHTRKDLPSWVTDWSYTPDASSTKLAEWNYLLYISNGASNSTKAEIHSSPNEILSLSGYTVDEVCLVGPEIKNSKDSGSKEWKAKWENMIGYPENMNSPYISGCTVEDAYHRTLTKSRVCLVEPETGAFLELLVLNPDKSDSAISESDEKTKYDYLFEVDIQGQRLFTTQKGYFGISSSETQIGDFVCILLGGNVPFILRPTDQPKCQLQYDSVFCSFVGQAYIHGIMHGNAIRERRDKMIFSLQ